VDAIWLEIFRSRTESAWPATEKSTKVASSVTAFKPETFLPLACAFPAAPIVQAGGANCDRSELE
jgi:hypothetical protein